MIDYQVEQINNNNNSTHLVPSHWGMGGDDADIPNIWQYMHQVALRTDLKKNKRVTISEKTTSRTKIVDP